MNPPWTRTAFPFIAGVIITYLLTRFTSLDQYLAILSPLHITQDTITLALAALIGYAWHTAAVKLGARWPWIEKLMLGSALVPVYVTLRARNRKPTGAIVHQLDSRTLDGTKYMDTALLLASMPTGSLIGKFRLFLNWLMLGNSTVGDCVVAGILHAIMWGNNFAGRSVKFSEAFAIKLYSLWTGYVPGDQSTDRGTDPDVAMKAWAKAGITDAAGVNHKIAAWFYVPLGHFTALRATIWLFGSAGICFDLPQSAQDQFPSRKWTVVPGSPSDGGHFVIAVDDDGKAWTKIISWAAVVRVARQFMLLKSTRWYGYVLEDDLVAGKDWHGFNMAQLLADRAAIRAAK